MTSGVPLKKCVKSVKSVKRGVGLPPGVTFFQGWITFGDLRRRPPRAATLRTAELTRRPWGTLR
jgi:hypothetical protein